MQRKLAGEARREKLGKNFNIDNFQQSLWCEKEIIRSIMFMYYAYQKFYDVDILRENHALLENFHQLLENSNNCEIYFIISCKFSK